MVGERIGFMYKGLNHSWAGSVPRVDSQMRLPWPAIRVL